MEFDRGKVTFIFLGILVLVAVGAVLKTAQSVILPLIIAWLLNDQLVDAPPLLPERTSGRMPSSHIAFTAPMWKNSSEPAPLIISDEQP